MPATIVRIAPLAIALATGGFVGSQAAGADVPRAAQTIAIPDSDVVLKLWQARDASGDLVPHYAISLDGETFSQPRPTSYDVSLRYGDFDPLAEAAPAVDPLLAAAEDTNVYIVQFVTQPLPEYIAAIEAAGGSVGWFVHRHSHLVQMDAPTRAEVEALPFVRWVGAYHPAYRLEEFLLDNLEIAEMVYPIHRYNVMVMDPAQKEIVAGRIVQIGGIVDRVNSGKYLVEATLTPEQLLAVARLDEVLFIDRWSPGEPDMDIAREIGGGNYIEAEAGYTGAGVRGEILDLGFNMAHTDFAAHPLVAHTTVNPDGHGASCSGICFGDGTSDTTARGMMPGGQGIVASWFVVSIGQPRYDHTGELVADPYFAVFQTASVGSDRTFEYTTISADTDAQLFDFDIVHCQSQSNAGNQDSRPQAWAKNIISGGGVYHYNTLDKSDDHWGNGASTGPAADGRVKPTLCSFYDSIRTTTCCSSTAYTSSFGGTSGATPIICGHAGLFFQMWADGAFGNVVDPTGTVFDNRAHMTTAKAVLVNTAEQYDWTLGGPNGDITRFRQGWGMPDLQRAYELRDRTLIVDETDIITNLQTLTYHVDVEAGEPALKATMVYADPPGNPGTLPHRINDLTMKVTAPDDTVYWGNNGLASGIWSTPGGEPNDIDTVENVFVKNPIPGSWVVEVVASEIVQDSHVETPEMDADFSLVVSGVTPLQPALFIELLEEVPTLVLPDTPVEMDVAITSGEEQIVPGSELVNYRLSPDDPFIQAPMVDLGEGSYLAIVPGAECDSAMEFYLSVEGDGGTVITLPVEAPDELFGYGIGEIILVFEDTFETDTGWSVEDSPGLIAGSWDRDVPIAAIAGAPPEDADGSGQCYVTGNAVSHDDVTGGTTTLVSPVMDASDPDSVISYHRWYNNSAGSVQEDNVLRVHVSDDGGATWSDLETVGPTGPEVEGGWFEKQFLIADIPGISNTDQFRIRFIASDGTVLSSIVEAAVDGVGLDYFNCGALTGDVDGDGDVDFADLVALLAEWGPCPAPPAECPADFDGSGSVDFPDLLAVLTHWS